MDTFVKIPRTFLKSIFLTTLKNYIKIKRREDASLVDYIARFESVKDLGVQIVLLKIIKIHSLTREENFYDVHIADDAFKNYINIKH